MMVITGLALGWRDEDKSLYVGKKTILEGQDGVHGFENGNPTMQHQYVDGTHHGQQLRKHKMDTGNTNIFQRASRPNIRIKTCFYRIRYETEV